MTLKLINVISAVVFVWAFFYLAVNFVVPQGLFIDYKELYAGDVCRDERQQLFGTRWVPFDINSRGVDQLWSYQENRYVDRYEWDGKYRKGETTNGWKVLITNQPGQYRWDAVKLELQLPFFIKVHVDDVRSNDFTISDCDTM